MYLTGDRYVDVYQCMDCKAVRIVEKGVVDDWYKPFLNVGDKS